MRWPTGLAKGKAIKMLVTRLVAGSLADDGRTTRSVVPLDWKKKTPRRRGTQKKLDNGGLCYAFNY